MNLLTSRMKSLSRFTVLNQDQIVGALINHIYSDGLCLSSPSKPELYVGVCVSRPVSEWFGLPTSILDVTCYFAFALSPWETVIRTVTTWLCSSGLDTVRLCLVSDHYPPALGPLSAWHHASDWHSHPEGHHVVTVTYAEGQKVVTNFLLST